LLGGNQNRHLQLPPETQFPARGCEYCLATRTVGAWRSLLFAV
jgi:hypothetical protein